MDRLGREGEKRWIPAQDLKFDPSYQRAIHPAHLAQMMADFRPNGLGTLQISERDDDGCYVIDGQHRVLCVLRKGIGHLKLKCEVLTGLSIEEERDLFLLLNRGHLPLSTYHAFHERVRSDEVNAGEVAMICQRLGITIVPPGKNLGIAEVGALALLDQLAEQEVLEQVLGAIRQSPWHIQAGAYRAIYVRMVWQLLREGMLISDIVALLTACTPQILDQAVVRTQDRPGTQLSSYLRVLRGYVS